MVILEYQIQAMQKSIVALFIISSFRNSVQSQHDLVAVLLKRRMSSRKGYTCGIQGLCGDWVRASLNPEYAHSTELTLLGFYASTFAPALGAFALGCIPWRASDVLNGEEILLVNEKRKENGQSQ